MHNQRYGRQNFRDKEYEEQSKARFDEKIIFEESDPETFINHIRTRQIKDNTKRQIRKLYDEVISEKPENENEIKQKVAKLIIMVNYAKNRKSIDEYFGNEIEKLLNYIMKNPRKEIYEKFVRFFEALIAFKARGD